MTVVSFTAPSAHLRVLAGPTASPLATLVSVSDHYRAPGWFTRNVFNQLVAFLTRQGISVLGSRVLAVKGRTSGQWRTTPVNLLIHDGRRYLVAPRGETQWVRNLRAAGTGELRVGRRAESSVAENSPTTRKYRSCAPTSRGGRQRSGSSSRAPGRTRATTRSAPSRPSTRRSRFSLSNKPLKSILAGAFCRPVPRSHGQPSALWPLSVTPLTAKAESAQGSCGDFSALLH